MPHRRSLLLVFTLLAMAGFLPGQSSTAKRQKEFSGPDAAKHAIKALIDAPRVHREGIDAGSLPAFGSHRPYLSGEFYRTCPEAIEFLERTRADVDAELLKLAKSEHALTVRYRAVHVLATRGNDATVPILLDMGTAKDADERLLAWQTYHRALKAGKLKRPADVNRALEHYKVEQDEENREAMEEFLGEARVAASVAPLLASLEKKRSSRSVVVALGALGDKAAVPHLIRLYKPNSCAEAYLTALGRIGTPDAVDFLIDHLKDDGAVEALFETKSPRALAALEKHWKTRTEDSSDRQITRVCLIRLREKDPRKALLEIARNDKENQDARFLVFRALQEYDRKPIARDLLAIYRTTADDDIKRFCLWVLDDLPGAEITAAMMDHALQHKVTSKGELVTEGYLRAALNRRLETYYYEFEDLQNHIRKLRAKKNKER